MEKNVHVTIVDPPGKRIRFDQNKKNNTYIDIHNMHASAHFPGPPKKIKHGRATIDKLCELSSAISNCMLKDYFEEDMTFIAETACDLLRKKTSMKSIVLFGDVMISDGVGIQFCKECGRINSNDCIDFQCDNCTKCGQWECNACVQLWHKGGFWGPIRCQICYDPDDDKPPSSVTQLLESSEEEEEEKEEEDDSDKVKEKTTSKKRRRK